MLIEVTANDIEMGLRDNCRSCPVARALTRATKKPWQVYGNFFWLPGTAHKPGVEAKVPAAVRAFIEKFDRGDRVEPFNFEFTPTEAQPC